MTCFFAGVCAFQVTSTVFWRRAVRGCALLSAWLLLLVGVFLLMTGVAGAQAPKPATATAAGSVTAIQGKDVILRGGSQLAGIYGTPLQVGDRVTTAPRSQVTITLDDGTRLELAESSTVVIIANRLNASGQRAETRVDLLGGLLHLLVRFAPGNAPNYEEVDTPNAVAAARGTNYDIDYIKGAPREETPGCLEFTDVSVFEGTVGVSNPTSSNKSEVLLTRGQKASIPCMLPPTQTVAISGISGAAATGAAVVGGLTTAGVVGGVAGSGEFGGGGSNATPTPAPIGLP